MPIQRLARSAHEVVCGSAASPRKYAVNAARMMSLWLVPLDLARSAKS